MADVSRDTYTGLMVPYTLTLMESASSADPRGPHVAHPTPSAENLGSMALTSARVELAAPLSDTVYVRCQRGGHAAPSPDVEPATYIWTRDQDDDDEWRGWDPPTAISGWDPIAVDAATDYSHPSLLRLSTGRVLLAFEAHDTVGGGRTIAVWYRDPGDSSWTQATADALGSAAPASNLDLWPCLVDGGAGFTLLYYWRRTTASEATIAAHVSLDGGGNWILMSESVIGRALLVDSSSPAAGTIEIPHRIAGASRDGKILLMAAVRYGTAGRTYTRDTYRQYASSDPKGATFQLVGEWADTEDNGGRWQTIAADVDGWHMVHVPLAHTGTSGSYAGTITAAEHRAVGSPYEPLEAATPSALPRPSWGLTAVTSNTVLEGTVSAGLVTFCIDEAGRYWSHGIHSDSDVPDTGEGEGRTCYSDDRGRTWLVAEADGPGSGGEEDDLDGWWASFRRQYHPVDMVSVMHEGRVLLAHAWEVGSERPASVCVARLGGYTTVCLPRYRSGAWQVDRLAYLHDYLPVALPEDMTWALDVDVDVTISIASSGRLRIVGNGGGTVIGSCEYAAFLGGATAPAMATDGLHCRFVVQTESDSFARSAGMRFTIGDGAHYISARIDTHSGGIRLRQYNDGTTSYETVATATPDLSDGVEVLWAGSLTHIRVWYRAASDTSDRVWTELVEHEWDYPIVTAGIPAAGYTMYADVQHAEQAEWSGFHLGVGIRGGSLWMREQTNPGDLMGRPFAARGTYVDGGIEIRATGGPAAYRDTYTIRTGYDYPLSRALTPAPRQRFEEASNATGDLVIAVTWDDDDNTYQPGQIGIALIGHTFPEITVHLYDDDVDTWDRGTAIDLSIPLTRWTEVSGSTARLSNAAAEDPVYLIRHGEFDGGYVGGDTVGRTITHTFPGRLAYWTGGGVQAILKTDGDLSSVGSNRKIVPPNAVILLDTFGHTSGGIRRGVRITVPAASRAGAPGGVHKLGCLLVGPVHAHPDATSWGRTIETAANVDLVRLADGTTRTRVLGPCYRTVEINWQDGVDTRTASEDDDTPDHHTLAGGIPTMHDRTTPWQLEGILRTTNGPGSPVVYLPEIVPLESTETSGEPLDYFALLRRHQFVFGRLTDAVRLETVQGDEGVDEVFRLSLSIREEV